MHGLYLAVVFSALAARNTKNSREKERNAKMKMLRLCLRDECNMGKTATIAEILLQAGETIRRYEAMISVYGSEKQQHMYS